MHGGGPVVTAGTPLPKEYTEENLELGESHFQAAMLRGHLATRQSVLLSHDFSLTLASRIRIF